MDYGQYLDIVVSLSETRKARSGKGGERELRPVQKSAIQKAKELKK